MHYEEKGEDLARRPTCTNYYASRSARGNNATAHRNGSTYVLSN